MNDTNENIINNFIKAEALAASSDHPVKTNTSEEEVVEKRHKRNVASSLETALPITDGKSIDIISADDHNAEEEVTQGNDNQNDKSDSIFEVESSSNHLAKSNNDVEEETSETIEITKPENDQKVEDSGMSDAKRSNSSTESEKVLDTDISEASVVQIEKPPEETKPQIDGLVVDSIKEPVSELTTYKEELQKEAEKLTVVEKTLSSDTPKGSVERIDNPPDEITPQNDGIVGEADNKPVSDLITQQEGLSKEAEKATMFDEKLISDTPKESVDSIKKPPEEVKPLDVVCAVHPDLEPVSVSIFNQEELSNATEKPILSEKKLESNMPEGSMETTEITPEEIKPLNEEFVVKPDNVSVSELTSYQEELSKEAENPTVLEKELSSDILKRSVEDSESSPEQIQSQRDKEHATERTVNQEGLSEGAERPTETPVESVEATVNSLEEIKPLHDEFVAKLDVEPVPKLATYQEEVPKEAEKPTVLEQKLSSDIQKESVEEIVSSPEEIKAPNDECGNKADNEPITAPHTEQDGLLEAAQKPSVEIKQQDGGSISEPEQELVSNPPEDEEEPPSKPLQTHTSHEKLDDINQSSKTESKPGSAVDDKILDLQKSTGDLVESQLESPLTETESTLSSTNKSNTGKISKIICFFFFLNVHLFKDLKGNNPENSEAVSEADGMPISQPDNTNSVEVNSLQSVLSTLKTNHALDKENLQQPST